MIKFWFRYKQKCNADIKRNFYYMKTQGVVHDGISEPLNLSFFDILYPLFIMSGISLFITILYYWKNIKQRIFKN